MLFDSKTKAEAGDLTLAACSGTSAAAVVGKTVRLMAALNVGMPAAVAEFPLPPGGRPVAVDTNGPSVLTEDGVLWMWTPPGRPNGRWERVGSLLDEVTK